MRVTTLIVPSLEKKTTLFRLAKSLLLKIVSPNSLVRNMMR